jgi:DNA polymerase-4
MRAVTRSLTLDAPIAATTMLAEIAEELVRAALADHPRERVVTLLAISVSQIGVQSELQLELPLGLADEKHRPGTRQGAARWSADRAMDAIRARFGRKAIGYATVALDRRRSVPDAFRELAEKDLGRGD